VSLAVVVLLGACGQDADAAGGAASPSPTSSACAPTPGPLATEADEYVDGMSMISLMRTKMYDTVEQLDEDATLVVVATAGESHTAAIGPSAGGGFDHDMTVTCVLRGSYGSDRLVVSELGGPGVVVESHPPRIKPGAQYLLWLRPTEGPTATPDRFDVVGFSGRYAVSGDVAVRLDPLATKLPRTVSISEYQRG
jgi:hypothetical protein